MTDADVLDAFYLPMKKHVLTETSYSASMYEHRPVNGRFRCTAAGCYLDTDGRVTCARCAADRVVVKLTAVPQLLQIIARLANSQDPLTDELRARLRDLVARMPHESDSL